ncbi:MFS transporter [Microbacterium aerolatum]|uniref:MFS transporter n=1 Tax=Microbacterium aerolatum TaxID=153731 RepID=UPI0020014492|nr:MFS transporter [Microbacterium aerolatum]MCK3769750.1 MFS transporter [Microbacterium aerolatum]
MPADDRTARTGRRSVYLLAGVNLTGLGSLTAPVVAGLPLKIDALFPAQERADVLATVLAIGALAALVSNPLFGMLSDRTRGRFGRRRPWMLGGALAGLLGVAALGAADSLPVIVTCWVFTQTAYNAMLAATAALLADIVPDSRRAAASGVFTAAAFVGTLPPLVLTAMLPRQVDAVSLVMPIIAVVVVAIALRLPDAAPCPRNAAAPGLGTTPVLHARTARRAFTAVWLQRLAMQSAFSLASAFTIYLVIDRMTHDPVGATPVAMIATLAGGSGIVIGAAVGGAWASRLRRHLPFLVCGALGLAAGASLRSLADSPPLLWIASSLGGLAVGIYLAVNLALAMRVIPGHQRGTYLGVLNIAETIPQVLAPVTAAALLHVGQSDPVSGSADNYFMLYLSAAAVAMLSLATLPTLRQTSRGEVRRSRPHPTETGASSSRM